MTKEELYKWMKEQGLIKTYEMEGLPEDTEIKPDPAVKERHEKWKANLPEKEQQDFDYVFGGITDDFINDINNH